MKELYSLEKCKTKAAYSAKLKKTRKLDLAAIKRKFPVVMETKILLLLKIEGIEIICHGFGELLFKNCEDKEKMARIAQDVYGVGLKR